MTKVVLFSGGIDSAATLAMAVASCAHTPEDVLALGFRYGSLHQDAETTRALVVCSRMGITHRTIDLPPSIFNGSDSALLGQSHMPTDEYHDPTKETPSATIVPFRNGIFLAIATAVAESLGGGEVWIGVHATDHNGWAYPDCSPEFIGSMTGGVYIGTLRKVRLVAPFLHATKKDVVLAAVELGVPIAHTWSCYRGGEIHCGECPTCRERIKAFTEAGYRDPVPYEGLVAWPTYGLKEIPS